MFSIGEVSRISGVTQHTRSARSWFTIAERLSPELLASLSTASTTSSDSTRLYIFFSVALTSLRY